MTVPGIVESALANDEIAARVPLGGEDELFITARSSIIYRADGLLSGESIDEYAHDADRLTLSEGRRKTRFSLDYPLDGTREFTVPAGRTDDVLHPLLAGVLNGNGITDPGETVVQTYRFSELTLLVTSDRLVKHIGEAVWDGDFEQYHFADVTGLSFEDGSVATQIVLEVDGRPQRIKAPNAAANDVSERLKRALFDYHDVGSLEELTATVGVEENDEPQDDPSVAFGEGVDPLDASPPEPDDGATGTETAERSVDAESDSGAATADDPIADATAEESVGNLQGAPNGGTTQVSDATGTPAESASASGRDDDSFGDSGFEPAAPTAAPELLERIDGLEAAVDRQNELLERQQRTIEALIEELKRSRGGQ